MIASTQKSIEAESDRKQERTAIDLLRFNKLVPEHL